MACFALPYGAPRGPTGSTMQPIASTALMRNKTPGSTTSWTKLGPSQMGSDVDWIVALLMPSNANKHFYG
jgi:hypothetical protein